MKAVHILIAEDDANIRTGLVDTLESEGYETTAVADGEAALRVFNKGKFSLVILDIMMPGLSGYEVCKRIRMQDEEIPVVMLTAKGEEIDKVVGLKLGADDYITKPFGVNEFLARIEAVLRRCRRSGIHQADPENFVFGNAEIDIRKYKARIGDTIHSLSAKELHILQLFHAHPNEVLTRDRLLNDVWGINYFGTTRTLDQHIAQLRKKVETDPACPSFILTVHGIGYRYDNRGLL